jgi:hypothetical protein
VNGVHARRKKRNRNFDFHAKRRKEIVLIARHVGAAQTDDFDRYLTPIIRESWRLAM